MYVKNTSNFLLGVVYSVKEKVRSKSQKWGGIITDPGKRLQWEERLARQGSAYRRELTQELNRRIHRSPHADAATGLRQHKRVVNGQEIQFFSLADEETLKGKVVQSNIYHNGEFFLTEVGEQIYVCRDLGDRFIGDKEF